MKFSFIPVEPRVLPVEERRIVASYKGEDVKKGLESFLKEVGETFCVDLSLEIGNEGSGPTLDEVSEALMKRGVWSRRDFSTPEDDFMIELSDWHPSPPESLEPIPPRYIPQYPIRFTARDGKRTINIRANGDTYEESVDVLCQKLQSYALDLSQDVQMIIRTLHADGEFERLNPLSATPIYTIRVVGDRNFHEGVWDQARYQAEKHGQQAGPDADPSVKEVWVQIKDLDMIDWLREYPTFLETGEELRVLDGEDERVLVFLIFAQGSPRWGNAEVAASNFSEVLRKCECANRIFTRRTGTEGPLGGL